MAEQPTVHDPTRIEAVGRGIGRVLFGGYFLYSGINHFVNRRMLAQYAASKGVSNPEIAVLGSGVLLAVGGLAVLTGRQTKLGAAALVTFLLGVTPTMHDFWTARDESSRMNEFVNFTKNVALIGAALLTVAIPEPWPARIGMPAHRRTTAVALLSLP